ncbi:MAG: DUF512 domain-containing protein, partial [candidate division Zixibacteria bacterium]|nr:DUF512 domain-containing protein [candidate division Zixibacteria bacterium]
ADEQVRLKFADTRGREFELKVNGLHGDLGLRWEEGKIKRCKCKCIFCFVHQQPKGMRRALYIKDEDYRLSFTHGNFITLSNVSDDDIARIIEQRLSPLYVSVHATDDQLRGEMLGNRKLRPILPQLKQLAAAGIRLHTQVVLCRGINDGVHLEKTVQDLATLYPQVATLAVVPVGLTRYRQRLPRLRTYTRRQSGQIVNIIETWQAQFLKTLGTRFVWAADEFYVNANREFPRLTTYEEMAQFENGVGMAREIITGFNRRRRSLRNIHSKKQVLLVTGRSAWLFLTQQVMPYLLWEFNLRVALQPVANRFWGKNVTVSGLLMGRDIIAAVKPFVRNFDTIVLPPNCLNADNLFLDDVTLREFEDAIERPVVVGSYNIAETIKEVYS